MRIRLTVMIIGLGWLTTGLGIDTAEAQCTDNGTCGIAQYCQKSVGACDGEGACSDRPSACPDVWAPVCGCDVITYGNSCLAAAAGINVSYEGQCLPLHCLDNDDCLQDEYCSKPTGDCSGDGSCTEKPLMCPLNWDPVCGCDGVTYANSCIAAQTGVNVASEGECPPPPCQENGDCGSGLFCLKSSGECGGEGLCTEEPSGCPEIWDPVCGCDEATYGNECEAHEAGVNVAYEGDCLKVCTSSADCLPQEYCDTEHNGCWGAGACRVRPLQCPLVYNPVCGCNELTYNNACFAANQEVTVVSVGICGPCPYDPSTDCIFSDSSESGGTSRWSSVVGN